MKNESGKNTIQKYQNLYMSLGMCFGSSGGLIFGISFDNMALGMCLGMSIGMCIGIVIGQAKDKRLSENTMIIRKVETANNLSNLIIYINCKNEIKKQYIVTEKKMKEEKFAEGDRVAEEINGSLVSLESK